MSTNGLIAAEMNMVSRLWSTPFLGTICLVASSVFALDTLPSGFNRAGDRVLAEGERIDSITDAVNDARWTGNGSSDAWTDNSNWEFGNNPTATSSTNTYYGNTGGRKFTDMSGYGSYFSTGHFYFDATSSQFNLGGTNTANNFVRIFGGIENGPTFVSSSTIQPTQTFSATVALGANNSWVARNGDLIINSANIYGNSFTLNLSSGGNTGRTITFNGVLDNGTDNGGGLAVNISTVTVRYDGTAANTYTGTTTINSGSLVLSKSNDVRSIASNTLTVNNSGTSVVWEANNQIAATTNVVLNGGTLNTGGFSEANTVTATTAQPGLGSLTLQSSSIIDLANGASVLAFANSSGQSWSGTLSIYNWTGNLGTGDGTDRVYFGTDNTGLTPTQLGMIQFFSGTNSGALGSAMILSDGEIVPVPEPGTWAAGILSLGALGFSQRRRLVRLLNPA